MNSARPVIDAFPSDNLRFAEKTVPPLAQVGDRALTKKWLNLKNDKVFENFRRITH